jgi:hypothetical protein
MSVLIRVHALQDKPSESNRIRYPQKESFVEALNHFKDLNKDVDPPGLNTIEQLFRSFLISPGEESILNEQYVSIVRHLGQWVAGDEKLFHWTGESSWLRLCPNKDDYIGFWFYMLCGRLASGKSVLLHTKSHTCDTVFGGGINCSTVMAEWAEVIDTKTTDGKTLLVADSYYLDHAGWEILTEASVPFICGVQPCRFPVLSEKVMRKSKHEGKTALMYNEKTQDMFVTHWYSDSKIGRKFVLSNAYSKCKGNTRKAFVPGCDDFSLMFNTCDHFNRSMNDKTWPHRCGSTQAQLHNYYLTCMLINTMNIFCDFYGLSENDVTFQDFGVQLADELYEYSCTITQL